MLPPAAAVAVVAVVVIGVDRARNELRASEVELRGHGGGRRWRWGKLGIRQEEHNRVLKCGRGHSMQGSHSGESAWRVVRNKLGAGAGIGLVSMSSAPRHTAGVRQL